MTVRRATLVPIILGTCLTLFVLSFASHVVGVNEFGYAVNIRDRLDTLPPAADWLKTAHPFFWTMPVAFGIWGAVMLLRRTTDTGLAWYLSSAVVVAAIWACFSLLVLHFCDQTFYVGPP